MKKNLFLSVIFVFACLLSISACKNNVAPSTNNEKPETFKRGQIALEAITIGDKTFENTIEVYVTGSNGITIKGADPHFKDDELNQKEKGVFVKGRTIRITPFIMSKYEVTQELYKAVMTGNPDNLAANSFNSTSAVAGERAEYKPAEKVNWFNAVYFCNRLSEKTNLEKVYTISIDEITGTRITSATVEMDITKNGYRLPTEAEWELAARGGNPDDEAWWYEFSGNAASEGLTNTSQQDDGLDAVGWYDYNSVLHTHEVGKKKPNTLGIFDMSGNVFEWCWDWYNDNWLESDSLYTKNGIVINPQGPVSGEKKTCRGGAYESQYCRSMLVMHKSTGTNYTVGARTAGIRLVRTVK